MAIQIPLIVFLQEGLDYSGHRRMLIEGTPDLSHTSFDDRTSSIIIRKGPNYQEWVTANQGKEPAVGFYEKKDYAGAALVLKPGAYANIHNLFNFGNIISSVKFFAEQPPANPILSVRLIVELYRNTNFLGSQVVLTEDCPNISTSVDPEFNDTITSVKIKQGPNYVAGNTARFFKNTNYGTSGGWIDLAPGEYNNIGVSHGFNDVVSSVKIQ